MFVPAKVPSRNPADAYLKAAGKKKSTGKVKKIGGQKAAKGGLWRALLRLTLWAVSLFLLVILLFRFVPIPVTAFMIHHAVTKGESLREGKRFCYRWTPMEKISPEVALAVIGAEDQLFPVHSGFDYGAIRKTMRRNAKRGKTVAGASTISQQVAKNLFLWPGKNFVRKGIEAGLTVVIELVWPKRRILEVYLNTAEFGEGVFGVGEASRIVFDKRPSRLTRSEAALLAAALPNPARYRPERPSDRMLRKRNWIMRQMEILSGDSEVRVLVYPRRQKETPTKLIKSIMGNS